jgi:phenylalanyl-tRNA synthetase alpha chain
MSEINELEKMIAEAALKMSTADEHALRDLEIKLLGRKGEINRVLGAMAGLELTDRAELGAAANLAKQRIEEEIGHRRAALSSEFMEELAEKEWIDTSEPGLASPAGHEHPTNIVIGEIVDIFGRVGFRRARYVEAEWDHYAFEVLNMPKDHPARDDWETFFLDAQENKKWGKLVLTPHTSNAQGREMERRSPPIRMISIGKCYRRQADITHLTMFHQFEGLVIEKGAALTHLKGVLDYFTKNFFGSDRIIRLRPHHFKFTEPSFEIDISCDLCKGTGKTESGVCRVCKSGWLELGGAGMIHPNVLAAGKIDSKIWSGFAFGWGVERTMMMRSGLNIPDIRLIYNNDSRFLAQF